MTICVAAIATDTDGKECIVFATDRMVSVPIGHFEHDMRKYQKIDDHTVAMLAGRALLFDDLILLPRPDMGYDEIVHEIFSNFKRSRWKDIENSYLETVGLDLEAYLRFLNDPELSQVMAYLFERVMKHSLECEMLVIGLVDGIGRITYVSENECTELTPISHGAIGSGGIQAANTLYFQRHYKDCSVLNALFNIYKAKKNAEVSGGVGRETNILILRNDGIFGLSDDDIKRLNRIYMEERKFSKDHELLMEIDHRRDVNV